MTEETETKPVWFSGSKGIRGSFKYQLNGEGFFISYNPEPFMSWDQPETALVFEKGTETKYLILNGDWREAYESLVPKGLEICIGFYNSKKAEFDSPWSTPE